MEGGAPKVIPGREGAHATPSVVAWTAEERLVVGYEAKAQAVNQPDRTIFGIPRLVGRRFDSVEMQQARRSLPYEIVEAGNEDAHVRIGDRIISPPELCAVLLAELRAIAELYLDEAVGEAVVTVPTSFNDIQRQAVKDAGTIAGLNVCRILSASGAAALASDVLPGSKGPVAFCDLGGGTFDVAIVEYLDGIYQVLASGGESYLGGEDIDQLIINWMIEKFNEVGGIDLSGDRNVYPLLKGMAEKAKQDLSDKEEAEIVFAFGGDNPDFQIVLSREECERFSGLLVGRTLEPCRRILKDAGLTGADLDKLILVGAQSQMPRVAQVMAHAFGKEPSRHAHVTEAVSMGAAIQAGILDGAVSEKMLLDITPHALGIETQGGAFTTLIERHSSIPTRKNHVFTTVFDNQQWVDLHVLQGEGEQAEFNTSLGKYKLTDIPPGPKGVPQFEVAFEIDIDGIAGISAKDQATDSVQNVAVRATRGLSRADVEALRKQFDALHADELKVEKELLRAEVQMLMASVRHALEKFDTGEQEDIERTLDDAQQALDDDPEQLKPVFTRLVEAADKLTRK
jgi:molecular chaperone DnaK